MEGSASLESATLETPVFIPCTFKVYDPADHRRIEDGAKKITISGTIISFVGCGANSDAWGSSYHVLAVVALQDGTLCSKELTSLTVPGLRAGRHFERTAR